MIGHPDSDCEVARGVGALCTCATPEDKAEWARERAEVEAERDAESLQHMKRGDTTACGAPKVRGNSYYEWAYVNCPACLATRAPEFARSE
jgi:hypothetical protein